MLERLKEDVCKANIELSEKSIVIYTWGNVSGIDRQKGLVVIKPSGVSYEDMAPEDMVVVDLESGEVVEGNLKPSSDHLWHPDLSYTVPSFSASPRYSVPYGTYRKGLSLQQSATE